MRDHKGLNEIARIIRRDIVSMIHRAKSGHPGGSLSVVEILTALYFDEMNVDSSNPKMEDRDRFVLSKDMLHQHYMLHWLKKAILIRKN